MEWFATIINLMAVRLEHCGVAAERSRMVAFFALYLLATIVVFGAVAAVLLRNRRSGRSKRATRSSTEVE